MKKFIFITILLGAIFGNGFARADIIEEEAIIYVYDGNYVYSGRVKGDNFVFTIYLKVIGYDVGPKDSFRNIYYKFETYDGRIEQKYSWEDFRSGKVSPRQWATQKSPRNTKEVRLNLPKARLLEYMGNKGNSMTEQIFDNEFFNISLIFTGAEAYNDDFYKKLYLRVLIDKKD